MDENTPDPQDKECCPQSNEEVFHQLGERFAPAKIWGQDGRLLATGEVLAANGLGQPGEARFDPDGKAKLEELKTSAKYLSWAYPDLWPIELHKLDCPIHLHLTLGGKPVRHPFHPQP